MKEQIQEIIDKRDSITTDSALVATESIFALKKGEPTKLERALCEIILEQDNEKTELSKYIDRLKSELKNAKK